MEVENPAILAYRSFIEQHAEVSVPTWELLKTAVKAGNVQKGDFILEEGKTCEHVDFIYKGTLRAFSNKDGFEITTALYREGTCVTNMKSFSQQSPSSVSIQAIETVAYARVYKHDLEKLYPLSPELQNVGRAILEAMVVEENDWKEMYSLYNPEERYLFLLKKSPELLNRVPQQYIASFLGMRRETLSRIRSRTVKKR